MRYLTLAITVFAYLLLSPFISSVYAQQVSLSLNPPVVQAAAQPGKTFTITYRLENKGDPVMVKPYIRSFLPQDTFGEVEIQKQIEGPVKFTFDNSDVSLDKEFLLGSNEVVPLILRLHVPDNAAEKDYYYSLLFETQPPTTQEGVISARLKVTTASHLLLTVTSDGSVETKAKVSFFSILSGFNFMKMKIMDSNDPLQISLMLQNYGKNAVKPTGTITIKGSLGTKASYPLISQHVLAGSQRRLLVSNADSSCSSTTDTCQGGTTLSIKGFYVGFYDVSTDIQIGSSNKLFASTRFFAFPFKVFGVILVSVLVVLLVALLRKKRSNNIVNE